MLKSLHVALFVLIVVWAGIGFADDCRLSNSLEAVIDAGGAKEVVIDASAGFLHVEGIEDGSEVQVNAEACAAKESVLKRIELRTRRDGDVVVIRAVLPQGMFGSVEKRLDMTVTMPAALELRIDDGSGEVRVSNVASLELDDGSGPIDVQNIHGPVMIEDGSGEIEVAQVEGRLTVKDGSGNMEISFVDNDVVIEDDGSGNIDASNIGGSVIVRDDGSGNIRVAEVSGDFEVHDDGSGSIRHQGVAGHVDIPRD